jgi:hypothetical protein
MMDITRADWVVSTAWPSSIVRRYSSDRSQALLALLEGAKGHPDAILTGKISVMVVPIRPAPA